MPPSATAILRVAESLAHNGDTEGMWSHLRQVSLEEFGEFFIGLPNPQYPSLSRALPAMASVEVQRNWTGNSGQLLLVQTLSFVRSVQRHFPQFTGRPLEGAKILDFGCGYGRISRLMYHFTPPANLYGVDPMEESIRLCRESRMPGNFFVSDYLPESLPFSENRFDLIFSFSVFTHLSLRATRTALGTLRRYIAPDGLLVITIRPEEYWRSTTLDPSAQRTADAVLADHRRDGFAFVPHRRGTVDGDVTYGDTSLSLAWLAREFPAWRIVGQDHNPADPLQILVFLAADEKSHS